MKSPRVLIAVSFLLLADGLPIFPIWARVHTFSPTETGSAFLKNYTPTYVIKRFNEGHGANRVGRTAAYGDDSVAHTADFDGDFALCSEKFMPLMDALRDDVAAQLVGNGARILSQVAEARAGFHFDYKLGKTVGSVTITPLELTPVDPTLLLGHRMPLPNCTVVVRTSIKVAEKWFAKEPGLMQISQ